jgi:HK97 family phage major capsid protein
MSYESIETTITDVRDAVSTFLKSYKTRIENLERFIESAEAAQMRANLPIGGGGIKSLAEHLAAAPELKQFVAGNCRGKAVIHLDGKSISNLGYSDGAILPSARVSAVMGPPAPRLRVRDLVPRYRVEQGQVEFVKEVDFSNSASPVAETVSKGESNLMLAPAVAPTTTIAHWIAASRQALEDLSALRSYVDLRLTQGLLDAEDSELLIGSGTGGHINGLVTQAETYSGGYQSGDTLIDKVNRVIGDLESNGYDPDGLVLHPADWRAMTSVKTNVGGANTGEYILSSPTTGAPSSLWGLKVSVTRAMPQGSYLVGQFAGSVAVFERMPLMIEVSTEHSDFFLRNMVAIRAEERIALAVFRPAAFRYGEF